MDPFPGKFSNHNPSFPRTTDPQSVVDHMQNLNLNRPTMPNSPGFPQSRGPTPTGPPSQFAQRGPMAPPPTTVRQPSPFMSRPPPPGYLPPSVPAQPPQSAGFPAAPQQIPPMASVQTMPPPMGMMSNGPPPSFGPAQQIPGSSPMASGPPPMGMMRNGPPPSFGPAQPPQSASMASGPPMGMMRNGPPPSFGSGSRFMPPGTAPPFGASLETMAPPRPMGSSFGGSGVSSPVGSPFPISGQGSMPPPGGTWPMPQGQMPQPPMGPGAPQPPRMYGMPPPPLGNQSMASHGALSTGSSKIDPNQIPRPLPSSTTAMFTARQGNQANTSPLATSDYMARDTGNCSPRFMRCTINQIPCMSDLLTTAGMPLALLVQPLALTHPSEDPIQIVDFGESGPVRCSRCKGYVNPFMKFIDQGRRFICNFCGFTDVTPREYVCNLGPDGRRRDADERPELCRGTVEFIATKEYMVRDPMPAVYFFLVDVSMNAVQTGATAAACSAISQVISVLPEGPRTIVGMATFDSTIHFYNLKRALQQPLMLIVPDIQDVYTPLQTDVLVPLSECREHLEVLLETIPTMFQSSKTVDSAFGAAAMAAFLAMKSTGGKLMIFQSVLPSAGIGALSAREAEGRAYISSGEKEPHKLLQPADKTYKTMAIEFAEYQVCVDVFVTTQSYVDIASISVIPRTTGGQVYYYYPFSVVSDPAKLYNDLRWNITRPQGLEAVMRVRCSQGMQVQEYSGNYCKRIPTDVDLPGIDCDKSILVTLKHDDKLQDGSECSFQCALLYTTLFGQRRIRVTTLSLPCTNMLSSLFRSADLDSQFTCFLKQAANEITIHPLSRVKEQVTNLCINSLFAYRKFCATPSSSGQLILPEALKLMPLYTLALIKSIGLRADGRLDDRSFWINYVSSISTQLAIPLVYPRMIAIHNLDPKEDDESVIPPFIGLSSEHIIDNGIYLLENGEDCLIYVGSSVDPTILQQIFGVSSVDAIPTQFVLQQFDNALSKNVNDVMNEIRRQRCSYLRIKLCKKGEPSGMLFYSYIVEDQNQGAPSYVDFLIHVHRQIQNKMAA